MKKFVFSMQKMHDYKKQILESEKNILMSLRREKNEYEQRLDTLACNMDVLSNQSQKEIAKGTTASKLMFYSMQMDGIKREETEVRYQINITDMKIEKQRRRVVLFHRMFPDLTSLKKNRKMNIIICLPKKMKLQ